MVAHCKTCQPGQAYYYQQCGSTILPYQFLLDFFISFCSVYSTKKKVQND